MSKIKYAYLKEQTWLYRRNYPADVALVLGVQALKQSLKTSDAKVARTRAGEVNSKFEATVAKVRTGVDSVLLQGGTQTDEPTSRWERSSGETVARLRDALAAERVDLNTVVFCSPARREVVSVGQLGRRYLNQRSNELRPGGFKSVRYSVGLFVSKFGDRPVGSLSREDGRLFLSLIGQLSTVIGKSETTRGLSLDRLVDFSSNRGNTITVRTQKRIWSQVNHFLDWVVYDGQLDQNPFRTVNFDQKVRPSPYAVPTDDEVVRLLRVNDRLLHLPLLFCLLTGMRAGEAAGLLREDLVSKGNLGTFVLVRPNQLRLLKTDAAERVVPLHGDLEAQLGRLPRRGPLFPGLEVSTVTKRFAQLRGQLNLNRPGLVFHSTRKWFITQCERTGVPEHFTASLVGHKSARSENGITYGIYSAGISDDQKRSIVDQIRLPA